MYIPKGYDEYQPILDEEKKNIALPSLFNFEQCKYMTINSVWNFKDCNCLISDLSIVIKPEKKPHNNYMHQEY